VLFPTHLAAAYVLARRTDRPIGWAVAGAALPDLVDKPLAALGVVGTFHSVGHSGLVLLAAGLGWALLRRRRSTDGSPVARLRPRDAAAAPLGWASHLALDAVHVVVNGRPSSALSLLWPLAGPPDPFGLPPIPFLFAYWGTPSFYLELAVWAAVAWTALAPRVGGDAVEG